MTVQIQTQGNGSDLVLLHGWGMNAAVWRELGAALAPHYCVHAVEMPGYGVGVSHLGESLTAIVETLAVALPQRLTVCGWSLGGQVALAWARAKPAQVERLILLATTPRFVCAENWEHAMSLVDFEEFAADVADSPPRARMRFLTLQANGDHAARIVLRELREAIALGGEAGGDALAAGLHLLRDIDLRNDLPQILRPSLVVHGVNDALIPHSAGEYLARTLPQAEFESLPGAGHAVFVSREATIAKRILEFHGRH